VGGIHPEQLVLSSSSIDPSYGATWVAKTRDTIEAKEAGSPQFRLGASTSHSPRVFCDNLSSGLWRQFFGVPSYKKSFGTAEETKWNYALPVTTGGVVSRLLSKSYIAVLPEHERKRVVDSLRNILETERKTWINEEEGVFEYPYETTVVTVRRK